MVSVVEPPVLQPARAERRFALRLDGAMLLAVTGLLCVGYVMVVSSSLHLGVRLFDDVLHYPIRQAIHICMGLAFGALMACVPLSLWESNSRSLMMMALGLLVLVLIPGVGIQVNGSYRWIGIGGFRLQVSEVVKLVSVMYMAGFLTRHVEMVRNSAQGVVKPLALLSIAFALLMAEPDFGSTFVIFCTAIGMMFLGGARMWEFVMLMLMGAAAAVGLVASSSYRMERITAFMDPWSDPLNSGFQLIQSLIAMGRGEWLGVGLGSSIQKLFYLPEAHTDFIFAVLGEELGLVGSCAVIALFGVLIWRAFQTGKLAERLGLRFPSLLAYGVGIWIGLQAFINIGVNMGVLPTKGLTLPLISYGGSSMIVMCSAIGLLCRVHHETCLTMEDQLKEKTPWQFV